VAKKKILDPVPVVAAAAAEDVGPTTTTDVHPMEVRKKKINNSNFQLRIDLFLVD
jgi:hypothetical protein